MVEGGVAPTCTLTPDDRVEDYLGAAARVIARTEEVGPFTLFRPTHAGPLFARPRPGSDPVTNVDLDRLAARFDELGSSIGLDWLLSRSPELADQCHGAGLRTTVHPLLTTDTGAEHWRAHDAGGGSPALDGLEVVALEPGSPLLRAALATVAVAFGSPSTETAAHGLEDRRLLETTYNADRLALLSDRIGAGQAVVTAALVEGEVVAVGHCRPVGAAAEVVGLATLPSFRRRGLATALTRTQVRHARDHGVALLLLTATEPVVEHLYVDLGFAACDRVGQAVG